MIRESRDVGVQLERRCLTLQDGRKLAYREYGQPNGFPIFYFHGWPSTSLDAATFHTPALKLHIRLVAVDRPGVGGSDFLAGRRLLDIADDIRELADVLHIQRFSVLGQSGGGPYALACAYTLKDRLVAAGVVAGMFSRYHPVGLDHVQMYPDRLGYRFSGRFPLLLRAMMMFNGLLLRMMSPDAMVKMFASEMPAKDREAFEQPEVTDAMKKVLGELAQASSRGLTADALAIMGNWGFDLREIEAKVLFWHGEADTSVPTAASRWLASQIPNSELTLYPDEGHGILFSHAEEMLISLAQ